MRIYGSPPSRPQRHLGEGGLNLGIPWACDDQNKATLHYQLIWNLRPDPHVYAHVCINVNNELTSYLPKAHISLIGSFKVPVSKENKNLFIYLSFHSFISSLKKRCVCCIHLLCLLLSSNFLHVKMVRLMSDSGTGNTTVPTLKGSNELHI